MHRWVVVLLLVLMGMESTGPAEAARRRTVGGGQARDRAVVVVHKGWPLARAPRTALVRPPRTTITVVPAVFLGPVAFSAVALRTVPARDLFVWEDGAVLEKIDDWTEFTLGCETRGRQLFLEISSGRLQFDWAEVVFENGDAQVVDFAEKTHGPGLYSLLDFRDGRKVSHVRTVARARSDEAKLVLRIAQ